MERKTKKKEMLGVFLTDQVSEVKVRGLILVLWLVDYTFSLKAWQSGLNVQSLL